MKVSKIAVVPMVALAAMTGGAVCPPQNPARVAEIAEWLAEKPGLGVAPISDRATWNRLAKLGGAANLVADAEKLLAKPVVETPDERYLDFTRNGNRTRYQKLNDKLNGNLATLVMAEAVENKGRFIEKAVAYFDAECAQRSWTLPAHDRKLTSFNGTPHIDLGSGMKSCLLATLLVILDDRLPAATREKVIAELDRRTFQPYLKTAREGKEAIPNKNHWWYDVEMNWNSVCNDTCVRSALLLIPDRKLRAEFVESAERTAPCALKGYTADGYCSEGMGYWNYGYGHYVYLGLGVRAATGGKVDLFADPKTKKVMEYAYGYQLQVGRCPSFADGGGTPRANLLALGRQVWPDLVNTSALESALRVDYSWTDVSDTFALRAFGQDPAPVAPTMDVLPARTWFPDAQVLLARDAGKGRKSFAIAIKGGHNNELHNHNDVGSYAVVFDGFEYAGDPAGEVYTRRTFSKDRYVAKVLNSYGHPVPVVGGNLQPTGRQFAAKVVKTDFTDAKDEIVLDLTAAYAVSNLVSLVRTMTFDRATRTVTVADKVAFSAPTAFESPLVTYADVVFDYDQAKLLLKGPKGAALDVAVAAEGGAWTWASELIENPTRPSAKRLAVRFAKPVTAAEVAFAFKAK